MDYALDDMVRVFAVAPGEAFGDGGPSVPGPLPWHSKDVTANALTFSRFCFAVAYRDYELRMNGDDEMSAFTDGLFDRGLDGVVIWAGQSAVSSLDDVKSAENEPIRLLFVQTKMSEHIHGSDANTFGADVQAFLNDPNFLRGVRTNDAIRHAWNLYDALRRQAGNAFEPDVTLVFCYAGDWMNMGFPNVRMARRVQLINLRASFPEARFSFEIMGSDDLIKAALRAGISITKTIKGISLLELPARSAAAGFIGVASAESLMEAFSRATGGELALDDTLFLDNPRYYRGDSERWNRGVVALAHSLNDGQHSEVIHCHNGINIVARDAKVDPADPAAIILVSPMIVNGCQTCYTLNGLRDRLAGADIVVKIAVTRDHALKNNIILGSNTQEVVNNYDMLSQHPYVRSLEREFDRAAPDTRLWLERRWNERVLWQAEDPAFDFGRDDAQDRIVTPRQLMDGFAATILGQPHEAAQTVLARVSRNGTARKVKIFSEDQEPAIYRAIGWMIAAGRKWGRFHHHLWMDAPTDPDNKRYWARHHFVYALWHIADETPSAVTHADLMRGPVAQRRFEALVEKLANWETRNVLTNLAGQAVENAEKAVDPWNKAHAAHEQIKRLNTSARFRDLIKIEADKLRP